MLLEAQCAILEKTLTEDMEPRKVAAYLCLHMGLSASEASALRRCDIDMDERKITVRNTLARNDIPTGSAEERFDVQPVDKERVLPIPSHVYALLRDNLRLYPDADCYIVSSSGEQPKIHLLQNLLFSINGKYKLTDKLTVNVLRDVFTRRCFECGIDLYTVGEVIGLKQLITIQKRFADILPYHPEQLERLIRYTPLYEPPETQPKGPKRMNLLILGAGSQGPVVREIAEAIGVFNEIAFLDDDPDNKLAIGPLSDYFLLSREFPNAIPSFGDSMLRKKWFDALRSDEAGYVIPRLIHPSATISPSAVSLGDGVVIEPKVIIGNNVTVGDNVIISAGAVLDKGCTIGANSHIGCSCTITKGSVVPPFSRIPAGTIFGNA